MPFDKSLLRRSKAVLWLTAAVAAVLFLAGQRLLGDRFPVVMTVVLTIVLAVLLFIIMMMAGFTVLRCLFVSAAELSLLIFLAQSYCDIPSRTSVDDSALEGLMVVGILYIAIAFGRSLFDALKGQYERLGTEEAKRNKFGLAIYLLFTILFVVQIYRVVAPIIENVCVYHSSHVETSRVSRSRS